MLNADEPWLVRPFSYGKWSHPFDDGGELPIRGAAYDAEKERLYLTLDGAGKTGIYGSPPLILTYEVKAKN
jgi:hypothetical protein